MEKYVFFKLFWLPSWCLFWKYVVVFTCYIDIDNSFTKFINLQ